MLCINLIILSCADIEKSKLFYTKLGLNFNQEQHENGPIHYSCIVNNMVLELYPASKNFPVEKSVRLGLNVESIIMLKEIHKLELKQINETLFKTKDPDGRIIFMNQQ